ncbi:MAG: hypothetical protein ACMUHB_05415 [Thermoplasmatota archaeon]
MVPSPNAVIDESEVEEEQASLSEFIDGSKGLGVLFFRKWEEDLGNFTAEFMDYMVQLDDGDFIDYGEVMKGDVDDPDDMFMLKKVSNYSQAVNNSLLEVWVLPPFYYMAVKVKNREQIQSICDMIKDYFGLESLFFSYPLS